MEMSKPHRSAPRRASTRKPLSLRTKAVMCAVLIVAFGAAAPTPAGADPGPGGDDPEPFNGISCSCDRSASTDGPLSRQQISEGIHQGLSGRGPAT